MRNNRAVERILKDVTNNNAILFLHYVNIGEREREKKEEKNKDRD